MSTYFARKRVMVFRVKNSNFEANCVPWLDRRSNPFGCAGSEMGKL